MFDAESKFSIDVEVVLQQQIVVNDDGSSERVLDGNQRSIGAAGVEGFEDLGGDGARQHSRLRKILAACLVTEGSQLALDCDLHICVQRAYQTQQRVKALTEFGCF